MADAKISQLAKLLSAVMEYEDLPVEIHNAIADWSCPSTARVSNSPELFQLILEDSKAHPEDYQEDAPKVGPLHVIKSADAPGLAEKETPQSQPAAELTLGQHVAAVLNHPDTPSKVYNALGDALADMYSNSFITDSAELCQALIYKFRELQAQKGGAA